MRHRQKDRSLQARMHLCDLTRMEPITDYLVANRSYFLLFNLTLLKCFHFLLLAILAHA